MEGNCTTFLLGFAAGFVILGLFVFLFACWISSLIEGDLSGLVFSLIFTSSLWVAFGFGCYLYDKNGKDWRVSILGIGMVFGIAIGMAISLSLI